MARFIALACLLLVAICAASPEFESSIEVIDNIDTYLADNPDAELIALQVQSMPFAKSRYSFGRRVPGDRILAKRNENSNYARMQDVRINLNYPQSGVGAVITHLDVNLEYDSNMGKLVLIEGGIGRRTIKIAIEAKAVTHFAANVTLWGV
uniref:Venom polypeptide n=1 Tax=Dolopus genitalis TaxID=2488630 RepID=A0A3G5BIE1_DOLGE|nr:venom polypeptide [Dolopus genitalis]